jgi:hypothetical protein
MYLFKKNGTKNRYSLFISKQKGTKIVIYLFQNKNDTKLLFIYLFIYLFISKQKFLPCKTVKCGSFSTEAEEKQLRGLL